MKTLGLMTSGGDAPGMNAAIRSVTRIALGHGFRVLGFKRGYEGILHEQFQEIDARSVSNAIQRGGTILKTARSTEFLTLKGQRKAARNLQKLGVDALVLIGGDGTFRGAMDLAKVWRGQIIGIPGPSTTICSAPTSHSASTPPSIPPSMPSTKCATPQTRTSDSFLSK